jgi:hypothetical protein
LPRFFAILGFTLWLLSAIWAFGDAERRGKSGCLVVLIVLLLPWPVGLIAWLVFRPERHGPTYRPPTHPFEG